MMTDKYTSPQRHEAIRADKMQLSSPQSIVNLFKNYREVFKRRGTQRFNAEEHRVICPFVRIWKINYSQSGFTIVESLMAIVVVGILMSAIAPVIALSVSTRVQARRVELATLAARTYIDGVQSGAIAAPNHAIILDEIDDTTTPKQFSPQRGTFASVAAPTSSGSLMCTATEAPYCQNTSTSSLYYIDLDGGGYSITSSRDTVIQAFRTSNAQNYILGLRVYRADAFSDTNALKTQKQTGTKQATFTAGLGDRKAPLVEMTTEIVTSTTLRDFCDRLSGCN